MVVVLVSSTQVLTVGCAGRRYEERLRMHSQLLTTLAVDAAASLEERAAMPEVLGMRYALRRAQGLAARSVEGRAGSVPRSLFERLVADYAVLVNHIDRTRALAGRVEDIKEADILEARRLAAEVAGGARRLRAALDDGGLGGP